MHIICNFTDDYVYPFMTMANSLIRNTSRKDIRFHVFTTRISKRNEKKLLAYAERKGVSISIMRINGLLDGVEVPKKETWVNDVYLKVLAFHYLPEGIDKALYTDCDTLYRGDISEFHDADISEHEIAVVEDRGYRNNPPMRRYVEAMNLPHPYLNSGLILMNLKMMRENWDYGSLLEIIKTKNYRFCDQDLLNVYCTKILFMDERFNFQMYIEDTKTDFFDAVMNHYVGRKPWDHLPLKDHESLWWKEFSRGGWPLKRAQFFLKRLFGKKVPKAEDLNKEDGSLW